VFLLNSRLGLVSAACFGLRGKPFHLVQALLLPKLRSQFAEFLNMLSLVRLGVLHPPTCVGLGYGQRKINLEAFLGSMG
jgi:hypothetical protein